MDALGLVFLIGPAQLTGVVGHWWNKSNSAQISGGAASGTTNKRMHLYLELRGKNLMMLLKDLHISLLLVHNST